MKKQTLSERIIEQIGKNIAVTDGKPYISVRKGRFYLRARLNTVGENNKPKVINYGLWENKSFETEEDLLFALINTDTWARPINQKSEMGFLEEYIKDAQIKRTLPEGIEEKKVYKMDYGVFDELVNKHLPNPNVEFESVPHYEWGNMESHEVSVNVNDKEYDWDARSLNAWLDGTAHTPPSSHVLLRELARRKILPYGDYLIDVFW